MVESPLAIIAKMILVFLQNTVETFFVILSLFGQLGESLLFVGSFGITGFVIAALIFGLTGFFLLKFFFRTAKTIVILGVVGFIILAILLVGLLVQPT